MLVMLQMKTLMHILLVPRASHAGNRTRTLAVATTPVAERQAEVPACAPAAISVNTDPNTDTSRKP